MTGRAARATEVLGLYIYKVAFDASTSGWRRPPAAAFVAILVGRGNLGPQTGPGCEGLSHATPSRSVQRAPAVWSRPPFVLFPYAWMW